MSSLRWRGILLFVPVPVVLYLFTRRPFGDGPSLIAGLIVMATHALYARPFARAQADRRCLWTGADLAAGEAAPVTVREPRGETTWRARSGRDAQRLAATLEWMSRHRAGLRLGIVGSLAGYVLVLLLSIWWADRGLSADDAVALFQIGVAVTVAPLGWLASRTPATPGGGVPATPFPVHIQSLIGTVWVLWLFRIVGPIWFVQGLLHVLRR